MNGYKIHAYRSDVTYNLDSLVETIAKAVELLRSNEWAMIVVGKSLPAGVDSRFAGWMPASDFISKVNKLDI